VALVSGRVNDCCRGSFAGRKQHFVSARRRGNESRCAVCRPAASTPENGRRLPAPTSFDDFTCSFRAWPAADRSAAVFACRASFAERTVRCLPRLVRLPCGTAPASLRLWLRAVPHGRFGRCTPRNCSRCVLLFCQGRFRRAFALRIAKPGNAPSPSHKRNCFHPAWLSLGAFTPGLSLWPARSVPLQPALRRAAVSRPPRTQAARPLPHRCLRNHAAPIDRLPFGPALHPLAGIAACLERPEFLPARAARGLRCLAPSFCGAQARTLSGDSTTPRGFSRLQLSPFVWRLTGNRFPLAPAPPPASHRMGRTSCLRLLAAPCGPASESPPPALRPAAGFWSAPLDAFQIVSRRLSALRARRALLCAPQLRFRSVIWLSLSRQPLHSLARMSYRSPLRGCRFLSSQPALRQTTRPWMLRPHRRLHSASGIASGRFALAPFLPRLRVAGT